MNNADKHFPRQCQPTDTRNDDRSPLESTNTASRLATSNLDENESSSSVEILEINNSKPLAGTQTATRTPTRGDDHQPQHLSDPSTSLVGRSILVPLSNHGKILPKAYQSPVHSSESSASEEEQYNGRTSSSSPLDAPMTRPLNFPQQQQQQQNQHSAFRIKRVITSKQTGGKISLSAGTNNQHALSSGQLPPSFQAAPNATDEKLPAATRTGSASSHSSASSFVDQRRMPDTQQQQQQSMEFHPSRLLARTHASDHGADNDVSDPSDDENDGDDGSLPNGDNDPFPNQNINHDDLNSRASSESPEVIDLTLDASEEGDSDRGSTVESTHMPQASSASADKIDSAPSKGNSTAQAFLKQDYHDAVQKSESTESKQDNRGHNQLATSDVIVLLDSSEDEDRGDSNQGQNRYPKNKRSRPVDEAGCDSSDDEMAKILESMNKVSASSRHASSPKARRRMRNSLGSQIRNGQRSERQQRHIPGDRSSTARAIFTSPRRSRDSYPSSASSASEGEDSPPHYPEEDTKPPPQLRNSRTSIGDASDEIEIIELLDDSSDDELHVVNTQQETNGNSSRTVEDTILEQTEQKVPETVFKTEAERQITPPVLSDESVLSDKALSSTTVAGMCRPPEPSAFSKLVYGSSTADRIGFWQGDRLFQRRADAIIFEDDAFDESSVEVSSSATSYECQSDDQSSRSSSDDSSFRGSPPKRKGIERPSLITTFCPSPLSRFEDLLEKIEPPPQIERKFTTRNLAVTNKLLPPNMNVVEHLSTFTYNDLGQPVWTFVVYGGCDETLYRFRIDIDRSTIPGAGWGAFITYLGSSHLQPRLCRLNNRIMERRTLHSPKTSQSITFRRPDGQLASLKLTGTNLHGNDNNLYWPQTMLPLKSSRSVPGRRRPVIEHVYLTGQNLHDDPELRALRSRESKHDKDHRIGHLNALLSTDYVHGNAEFNVRDSSIYVGRYGPLRREDRKPESLFLCKSFIFQHLPAGYCFQVVEEMNNEVQIVDICDDQTGITHAAALKSIPTYVNEVGHDLSILQNVFITDHEERSIEYTFVLPDEKTLRPGEKMELLTNYYSAYETDRERNGYGLANIFRGKKGDDDMAAYMKDRLRERLDTIDVLATTSLFQWTDVLEQIKEVIHDPLVKLLKAFVDGNEEKVSTLQITALRRAYWLRSRFEELLDSTQSELITNFGCDKNDHDENVFSVRIGLVRQCRIFIAGISCPDFIRSHGLYDKRCLNGPKKQSISSALEQEAVEECCFALRKRIVKPFDDSVWCSIACDLLKTLSRLTAENLWPIEECVDEEKVKAVQEKLLEDFLLAGEMAASRVRKAIRSGNFQELSFSSGLREGMILTGTVSEQLAGKHSIAFFLDHSTTPKGYVSAICQRLQYYDSMMTGLEVPLAGDDFSPLDHNERYVMTHFPIEEEAFRQLGSKPFPARRVQECHEIVNENWYLAHQVGYLVAAFGQVYCTGANLIESIGDRLGIDSVFCSVADRGIQADHSSFKRHCRSKDKIRVEKVLDLPKSILLNRQRKHDRIDRTPVHPHFQDSSNDSDLPSQLSGTKKSSKRRKSGAKKAEKTPIKLTLQKKKNVSDPFGIRKTPILVYEGEPDEEVAGGWPRNWIKRVYQRQSGNSKGHTDRYWFSPAGHKLRSMVQVSRYFKCLEAFNGDESKAWEAHKRSAPA